MKYNVFYGTDKCQLERKNCHLSLDNQGRIIAPNNPPRNHTLLISRYLISYQKLISGDKQYLYKIENI